MASGLPPLPTFADPLAALQSELERISDLHRKQALYVAELETLLARRSQELLEADEREASLVRRFHLQKLRILDLERDARERDALIEQVKAAPAAATPRKASKAKRPRARRKSEQSGSTGKD